MDLNGECKGGGDGFIDRSRVRILLCDNDPNSLGEVFTLLSQCSYQVTSVKSARQVIDALNAEGPDIDIILAEIDLPMAKGMKMLRYITRDKDLRRIPVIMMSRQDEVPVVVKCLKLGAADYLVKPLRTNELLNLWTHMWRRRRMLGLAEKNMLSYEFDLVGSDPSDPNTNSTNLFSDDTDDRSIRSTNPQRGNHQEKEWPVATGSVCAGDGADGTATSTPAVAVIEPPLNHLPEPHHEPTKRSTNPAQFSSVPKKSRLKIGESSAFFTYVKSTVNGNGSVHPGMAEKLQVVASEVTKNNTKQTRGGKELTAQGENSVNGTLERSRTLPTPMELHSSKSYQEVPNSLERSRTLPPPMELHGGRSCYQEGAMNDTRVAAKDSSSQVDASRFAAQNAYPYYMHGVMNQVMMQSAGMMPQYGHQHPHCPPNHMNGMTGFPYYHHHHPMNTSLQHSQMSQNGQMPMVHHHHHHSWPQTQIGNHPSPNEVRVTKLDRREEALLKFRRKRNQRCFDKKIRYVNRKRLAERRPRVKGQFVRKMNGVNVDLNGQPEPDSADYDDEDEEDEEEEENRDSSPQDDALGT
ncbi:Two-component response regulator-like APRR1 [Raphanus sativus]|uniref:Pseudo-response regulator 1 n=1 Tax=Raphanus sativus TaxID=3726 RepID=A0A9W3DNH4_RAPSA|nr:two-component response regulator-like APRR1 [Raphanus sativus]KAJ4900317.1 Two-component response regulator-like APRR1 [Raphanus sativus]